MLKQIEWGVKTGPIANNAVLPLTILFFENLTNVVPMIPIIFLRKLIYQPFNAWYP